LPRAGAGFRHDNHKRFHRPRGVPAAPGGALGAAWLVPALPGQSVGGHRGGVTTWIRRSGRISLRFRAHYHRTGRAVPM